MTRRLALLAAVALTACSLTAGAVAAPAPAPTDKPGRSKAVYTSSVVETFHVPMRDGETLFVQVMRPVTPAKIKVPVILTLSPYNVLGASDQSFVQDGRVGFDSYADFFVPRGYARAIADVRGTRESSGCWDYGGVKERHDGYDLVQWLGTRAWSNGRVAMIGASYDGTTALMTAAERPSHLAAIVPIAAIDRWYDYAYHNGVRWLLNSESPSDEGIDTPLGFDFGFAIPPPTGTSSQATMIDAAQDRYKPCDQVAHTSNGYDPSPDYTGFWIERDYRIPASKVKVPALIVHGLQDYNVKASSATAIWRAYKGPKRLLLGNWTHANPSKTATGTWNNLLWRWFDQWLLKLDTGVMKEAPVHSQDAAGKWHVSSTWPPPKSGTLRLVPTTTAADGTDVFVDDPTVTEEGAMTTGLAGLGYLRYQTAPLKSAVRIAGEPSFKLKLDTSEATTHIAVTLADMAADGSWARISRGFFNPRYRSGLTKGSDLTPFEPFTIQFTTEPTDYTVAAGHSIVVLVSSSNAVWAVPSESRSINSVHLDGGTEFRIPITLS